MDTSNLNDYRVVDLKKALERRGLSKSGSKKELVDRLKAQLQIEQLHGKVTSSGADATELQMVGDEENEFVRNYLEQRQKLLTQQMEQKKKFEEESGELQSDEEDEPRNAESDDETDVESNHDSTEKEIHQPAPNYDESSFVEQSSYNELPDISSQNSRTGNADDGVAIPSDELEAESSSRPRSLSRSRSRSVSHDRQSARSSRTSSGSRSRSNSRGKSVDRSRSPSEDNRSTSNDKRTNQRERSMSPEGNDSSTDDKQEQTKGRRRSISQSSNKSRSSLSAGELQAVETSTNLSPACNEVEDESTPDNPMEFSVNDDLPASTHGHGDLAPIENLSADTSDIEVQFNNKEKEDNDKPEKEIVTDIATAAPIPDTSESVKPARKRRWGSVSVQVVKPSIIISTDSLKGLIPEIEVGSMSLESPMELDEGGDGSSKKESTKTPTPENSSLELTGRVVVLKSNESPEQSDTRAAKLRRTVSKEPTLSQNVVEPGENEADKEPRKDDEDSNSISVDSATSNVRVVKASVVAQPVTTVSKTVTANPKPQASRQVLLAVDDPVDVGRKSPSPSRHPPSNVVHVTGLVRPFTLGQLKELLGRTGNLQPEGFWIDNIKSHCYVVYETIDQAKATRRALHGKRWPATNPKLLGIEYRTFEEFEKRRSNTVSHGPVAAANKTRLVQPPQPAAVEHKKEINSSNDVRKDVTKPPPLARPSPKENRKDKPAAAPLREWDRHKLRQSRSLSREKRRKEDRVKVETQDKKETGRQEQHKSRDERRGRSRTDKPEAAAKVVEEPPAKLLDDLFRKTVAMPCIYWLPLTDEQANEKLAQEKQERLLRDQRRAEREQQLEAERQERLKARDERAKQDAPRLSDRDRQQPAQRRKFSEADDQSRRRVRSRSGGRANRR